MVDCKRTHDSLSDYIEGLLTGEQVQAIEAHLKRCPQCRDLRERVQQTMILLGSLPQITPSATFDEKLRERIRRERAKTEHRLWNRLPSFQIGRPWPALAFSMAIVVIGLGLFLFRGLLFQEEQPLFLVDGDDQRRVERLRTPTDSTNAEVPYRLTGEEEAFPNYVLPALSPQILELRREYRPFLWEPSDDQELASGETYLQGTSHMQHTVRYVLPSAYPQATMKVTTFNP